MALGNSDSEESTLLEILLKNVVDNEIVLNVILKELCDTNSGHAKNKILDILKSLVTSRNFSGLEDKILKEVCLPALNSPDPQVVLDIVCNLIGSASSDMQHTMIKWAFSTLDIVVQDILIYEHQHECCFIKLASSIKVLVSLATSKEVDLDKKRLLTISTNILRQGKDIYSGLVLSSLLPKLCLKHDSNLLPEIWNTVLQIASANFHRGESDPLSGRPLMILCSLADYFLADTCDLNMIGNIEFWNIVQSGFYERDSLTRKRAMYLLKRIIDLTEQSKKAVNEGAEQQGLCFWWSPHKAAQMAIVWQDFILIMETLEESQVHMIRPLLMRHPNLVQAASQTNEGRPLLHSSWLLTICRRMSCHDSPFILKAGLEQLLSIDLGQCYLLKENTYEDFYSALLPMLKESSVYHKLSDQVLGQSPPITSLLINFFTIISKTLTAPEQGDFLARFIHALSRETWSGTSLVFITHALSCIPPANILHADSLLKFRDMVILSSSSHESAFRNAIQAFLTTTATNLMDPEHVELESFLSFLVCIHQSGCLQRHDPLWKQVTKWLASQESATSWSKTSVFQYLQREMQLCLSAQPDDLKAVGCEQRSHQIVLLLVLAYDADLLIFDERTGHSVGSLLAPVTDVLLSMNSHAYLPLKKAESALRIIQYLLTVLGDKTPESDTMLKYITRSSLVVEIINFLRRRLNEGCEQLITSSSRELYLLTLLQVIVHGLLTSPVGSTSASELVLSCVNKVESPQSNEINEASQMQQIYAMCLLQCFIEANVTQHATLSTESLSRFSQFLKSWHPRSAFAKPQEVAARGRDRENEWGKETSSYLEAQWKLISYHLAGQSLSECSTLSSKYLPECLETLDCVSGAVTETIFRCLELILPHMIQHDQDVYIRCTNIGWARVMDERRSMNFWPTYRSFCSMALQPSVLLASVDSSCHQQLLKIFQLVKEKADGQKGILNEFLYLAGGLLESDFQKYSRVQCLLDLFYDSLLFGPVHAKGQRFEYEVRCFLRTLNADLPHETLGYMKEDEAPRTYVVSLLDRLAVSHGPDGTAYCRRLMCALMDGVKQAEKIQSYKNFPNSMLHRQKHRSMCALLVMHRNIDESLKSSMIDFLLDILAVENQPSVRIQTEWYLIKLACYDDNVMAKLWEAVSNPVGKKGSFLCSMMLVFYHCSKLCTDSKKQATCMEKLLRMIVPLSTVSHFSTRAFAQACMILLWRMLEKKDPEDLLSKHSILQGVVDLITNDDSQISRSTRSLAENYCFQLDPFHDFSIETIYYNLPHLTGIVDDEWILTTSFIELDPTWQNKDAHSLPLCSDKEKLACMSPGSWKVKNPIDDDINIKSGNVQKKMIPWRNMLPEEGMEPEFMDDLGKKTRKQVKDNKLILVSSLIDKVPNLGGLCRTAEIFGVSEFVIGSLNHIKDKLFQNLSVTAHKWVPIKEVKPYLLGRYLEEMRLAGYSIVGVEQTANSVMLTDFKFPVKTVLVLGNEKEGIPVDLLQQLDVCVEIPQQGIIRSLNVHVSGALLVWEYARQHILGSL